MVEDVAAFGFRVRTSCRRLLVIELWGELDILAAQHLSARLTTLARSRRGRRHLVLDLRQVTFLDCSGLSLLCAIRQQVLQHRGQLRLVIDDPRIHRLLRLARLADAFTVTDRLETALAPSSGGAHDLAQPGLTV